MTEATKPAVKAPAWPLETIDGARLIMRATAALLSGQAALCYLKPGVEGFRLLAGPLMDDAEALAAGAMSRSEARAERGPLAQFFKQNSMTGGKCPSCHRQGAPNYMGECPYCNKEWPGFV